MNFFSVKEKKYLEKRFEEKSNRPGEISFENFKDIVRSCNFDYNFTSNMFEKIKSKEKDKFSGITEMDIVISILSSNNLSIDKKDYMEYMEQLLKESDKKTNLNDPELKKLYDLLSNGMEVMSRKTLIEIISIFELPIKTEVKKD